jgi:hypothetical protein
MMPASRSTARFATAAAAVASALAYPFLPRRVVTHFDARGRPDRSVARQSAVVRSPAIMAALALIDERVGAWPGAHDRDNDARIGCQAPAVRRSQASSGGGRGVATELCLSTSRAGFRASSG